jgi:hypothetical protein
MPFPSCSRMVSGSFHFPSRVLCSVHSRYYCTIGLETCLGFEVGAPEFTRDFQRMLLRNSGIVLSCTSTGLSPSVALRSSRLQVSGSDVPGSTNPHFHGLSTTDSDCPMPLSIAFTNGISLISFPLPTKMLQSGRLPYPKGMTPEGVWMSNSAIPGSETPCVYPGHFAAWHDLLRRSSRAILHTARNSRLACWLN